MNAFRGFVTDLKRRPGAKRDFLKTVYAPLFTPTMKVSKLERLLLEDAPLFQERQISLVVEKGPAHAYSIDDRSIYLVDLSDGVAWMLGMFLEDDSTVDSIEPRSLLAALRDPTTTGIHILSARVCVHRRDHRLRPILYIKHCRLIHKGHTTPMSKQLEEMQNRSDIKKWMASLEELTDERFLAMFIQDEFWDVYAQHVEPYLEYLTTSFTTTTIGASTPTNNDTSQIDSPLPSSSSTRQPLLLIPPSSSPLPKTCQSSSASAFDSDFPPSLTWENIQQLILDTFDDGEEDDEFMDGFIPIPHSIWETASTTTTKQRNDTGDLPIPQQPWAAAAAAPMEDQTLNTTTTMVMDSWCQLFLDVTNEKTEYGRRKKLRTAKMEWAMSDTILALE